jgi:hypothetical protein
LNPLHLSFWDQVQLFWLRILTAVLSLMDGALHVRWGERLLQRMASRWQTQVEALNQAMAELEESRQHIQGQIAALSLQAAALYLGGRQISRGELRFDPAEPHDREILDATIDLLVKERLANIEIEEIEAGHYVYHLEPDWSTIRANLEGAAVQAEPEIAEWLREGASFVDEILFSDRDSQTIPSQE